MEWRCFMYLHLGWLLIAAAGFTMVYLAFNTWSKEKRGERFAVTFAMAICWVVGCSLVGHYHMYWYLYCVNVLAAGKYLFHLFANEEKPEPTAQVTKPTPKFPDIYD